AAVALLVGLPVWVKTTQVYRATLPLWDIERLASSMVNVHLTAALTLLIASPPGQLTVFACPRPHIGSQPQTRAYLGTGRGAVVWAQSAEGVEEAVTEAAFAMTSTEGEPLLAPSLGRVSFHYHSIVYCIHLTNLLHSLFFISIFTFTFPLCPGYDLSLTLLVPDPVAFNVSWNIKQGVEAFLLPFLSSLSPYILFNITSQVVYCVGLGVRARYNSESGYHVINEQQLSHAISPLEAKLGKISLAECGNVYNGELGLHNHTSLPVNITIEMKPVMEVFISQLRSLLGLWPAPLPQGMAISPLPAPQLLTDWEKDTWLRRRTVSTITMATGTLSSLANTLNTISNIVIDDNIGQQVCYAADGLAAAESAFFNPSLLALLSFPDDQKFAIYIPLFLPAAIPLLVSLKHLVPWCKKRVS
uniref:Phosphatidylinositol glycan anchor biosynthesis class S n=1 Tax=Eptatretus burgeri TaxID=7764 RepID=A0A8C4QS72_EPTBU